MTLRQFLNKYEPEFNPSDYDADVSIVRQEEKAQREAIQIAAVTTVAIPETIPGFRVQVLFTQDIEQADSAKDDLANLVPEEWVYVVYDAPYYRVRVGNYTNRSAASQMLSKLIKLGYKDAWVVPDNVVENPLPKTPDTFIEPEKR
jgi:hypothetical protein